MSEPVTITVSDDYTGEIADQAIAQRFTGGDVSRAGIRGIDPVIVKFSVGPMDNNAYLVTAGDSAVLVDAANDTDRILELLSGLGVELDAIITTHRHPDHWQALAAVAEATGAPTVADAVDAEGIPVATAHPLAAGEPLIVGDITFRTHRIVGHTPGSLVLALDVAGTTHLFVGDTLFPGGIGRTTSPEDFDSLYTDVTEQLFGGYPDDTIVHPGHGRDTTLGAERPQLAEWRARGW